jgi:hypothetical protein
MKYTKALWSINWFDYNHLLHGRYRAQLRFIFAFLHANFELFCVLMTVVTVLFDAYYVIKRQIINILS